MQTKKRMSVLFLSPVPIAEERNRWRNVPFTTSRFGCGFTFIIIEILNITLFKMIRGLRLPKVFCRGPYNQKTVM